MKIEMGIGWVPDPENGPKALVSATPGQYAAEIVKLRAALRSAEDILIEEREVMGAHPEHWKIANALDRAINRINRLS